MSVTATTRQPITLELMAGSKRRHRKERVVRTLFLAAAVLGLLISLAIVLALLEEAVRWLFAIDLGWLWTEGWFPRADEFDLLTILAGTVMIAVIAMLVAAPLGLGAAAYLSEYATPRTRRTLKPILETLASIPSVVLGYFALQCDQPGPRTEDLRVGRHVQLPGGRAGRRDPHDPAGRVGGRGRDARRAERPAGGCLRDRRPAQDRHHYGSCSRPRSRGSSRP